MGVLTPLYKEVGVRRSVRIGTESAEDYSDLRRERQ